MRDTKHKVVDVGNEKEDNEKLIGMLSTLLSSIKQQAEKLSILKETYHIQTTTLFEEEVSTMCNLSDNVEKRGIEKGQKIANAKNLIKVMKKMKFSLSDAMAMLEIDPSEIVVYKELIEQVNNGTIE